MSKRSSVLWSTCVLLGVALLAGRASAQNNPLITVNETGQGTLLFPASPPVVTTGVLAPDPGPGGLGAALTYNLLGPPSLVQGDVVIFDPGGGGVVSDIVRFNFIAATSTSTLVLYSRLGGGALADTGFPTALYANNLSITEVNGVADYTPTAGQPGFVAGFGVSYHVISDAAAAAPVPLPAGTWSLLGFLGVWGIKRALRKPALV